MITATSPTAQSTAQFQPGVREASTTGALSSDFDTFLQMLTAQMRNQDPLNPLDSTEFASQLATFSSVEQQVVTNDLLNGMITLLEVGGLGDMASWVGREVRTDAPAYFDGTAAVPLAVGTSPLAEEAFLEVHDLQGNLVQRLPMDVDQTEMDWTGLDDSGTPLPEGHYVFVVDNISRGESIGLSPVSSYQQVSEARIENGQLVLIVEGGHSVDMGNITGIRGFS